MSQISEDAVRATLATVREQLAAEITEAIEKAVREERKATVVYLKRLADVTSQKTDPLWMGAALAHGFAVQMIERGEHRREVTSETG
jgi:hypothetical protein